MMDEQTAWVVALQLVALFSIASGILLYLICKIRTGNDSSALSDTAPGAGKPVLITCCDNAIGLQLAIHLAGRGFRVFAGLKNGYSSSSSSSEDSDQAKIIRAWQKHRESIQETNSGNIIPLHLDVTREDLLYESVDIIRAHLPAGEDGMWAVICTNGVTYRGPLQQQDISHWDTVFKINVIGVLRVARTFQNLLKNSNGRIITIGITDCNNMMSGGLVAYAASRYAVEGASVALRHELTSLGIRVITVSPVGILPELLFSAPKLIMAQKQELTDEEACVEIMNVGLDFQPKVLSDRALNSLDFAITTSIPKPHYKLEYKYKWPKELNIFCRRI